MKNTSCCDVCKQTITFDFRYDMHRNLLCTKCQITLTKRFTSRNFFVQRRPGNCERCGIWVKPNGRGLIYFGAVEVVHLYCKNHGFFICTECPKHIRYAHASSAYCRAIQRLIAEAKSSTK